MPASPASSSRRSPAARRRPPAGTPAVCGAARSRQRRTARPNSHDSTHPVCATRRALWWPWQSYDNGTASCSRAHDADSGHDNHTDYRGEQGPGQGDRQAARRRRAHRVRKRPRRGPWPCGSRRGGRQVRSARRDRRRLSRCRLRSDRGRRGARCPGQQRRHRDARAQWAGCAAGVRHQCRWHHPGYRGGAPAAEEVGEPGRGERLERSARSGPTTSHRGRPRSTRPSSTARARRPSRCSRSSTRGPCRR